MRFLKLGQFTSVINTVTILHYYTSIHPKTSWGTFYTLLQISYLNLLHIYNIYGVLLARYGLLKTFINFYKLLGQLDKLL